MLFFLSMLLAGVTLHSMIKLQNEPPIAVCQPHKWERNSEGYLQCTTCRLNTKESLK